MKNLSIIPIRVTLVLLVALTLSAPAQAQPSRDRILGDLTFSEHSEYIDIQIELTFPVRYLRHFPAEKGDEIRIQLKPIAIGSAEREGLFKREGVTADESNPADVTEIVYEGANITGLSLTVYFSQERTFSVEQGNDYRSILVRVKNALPQAPTEQ